MVPSGTGDRLDEDHVAQLDDLTVGPAGQAAASAAARAIST